LVRVFHHISIFVADIFNIRLHKARLVKHLAVDFKVDCVLLRKIEEVTRVIAANRVFIIRRIGFIGTFP
jgi:hypothetical protein